MGILELFLVAVGLSMDAFAVAVCKGLSVPRVRMKHLLVTGAYFGGFQGLMPLAGYLLGSQFQALIAGFDHWLVFALLSLIGVNMIRESFHADAEPGNASFSFAAMLPLALATSIDALAVGVSFAFLRVKILPASLLIGTTTFLLSALGVKVGNAFGQRYKAKAERFGGAVLILMGVKILLEHLGVIGF